VEKLCSFYHLIHKDIQASARALGPRGIGSGCEINSAREEGRRSGNCININRAQLLPFSTQFRTVENCQPSNPTNFGLVFRSPRTLEKSALTDVSLSPVARVTHGFRPRTAGTHDGGSPTDASPSRPDTKKCIQVGRETYAVTSQSGTSYTFDTRIDTATCGAIVGRETIAPPPIEQYAATTPHIDTPKTRKYRKPRSGSDKKQKNTRFRDHQLP
jgi:hypothetical protein